MMDRGEYQVNVNEAAIEELERVNKLGSVLAARIIKARPFDQLDDLKKVNGIGPRLLDEIRPYLTITGQTTQESPASEPEPQEQEIPLMHRSESMEEEPHQPAEIFRSKITEAEAGSPQTAASEPPESGEETAEKQPSASLPHQPLSETDTKADEEEPAVSAEEPMVAVGRESEAIFYPREEAPEPETKLKKDEQVRALQVIDRQEEAQRARQAPREKTRSTIGRGELLAWVLGGSLVSLILGVLLTLGILALVNGSLRYRTEQQAQNTFAGLQDRLEIVDSRLEDTSEDITGLRTRLDAMEALSGRVGTLEDETANLQDELAETAGNLDEAVTQLSGISEEVESITTEMAEIRESTSRFSDFLQQLRSLLDGLFPQEDEGAQP